MLTGCLFFLVIDDAAGTACSLCRHTECLMSITLFVVVHIHLSTPLLHLRFKTLLFYLKHFMEICNTTFKIYRNHMMSYSLCCGVVEIFVTVKFVPLYQLTCSHAVTDDD